MVNFSRCSDSTQQRIPHRNFRLVMMRCLVVGATFQMEFKWVFPINIFKRIVCAHKHTKHIQCFTYAHTIHIVASRSAKNSSENTPHFFFVRFCFWSFRCVRCCFGEHITHHSPWCLPFYLDVVHARVPLSVIELKIENVQAIKFADGRKCYVLDREGGESVVEWNTEMEYIFGLYRCWWRFGHCRLRSGLLSRRIQNFCKT